MAQEMLEALGYTVTAVSDPREALRVFIENPSAVDLVITDQTMPHYTGAQLARAIKQAREEVPVILATGFGAMPAPDDEPATDVSLILPKPYTIRQLAEAARQALGSKATGQPQAGEDPRSA
jgi:CheY-like chemotaxis protein